MSPLIISLTGDNVSIVGPYRQLLNSAIIISFGDPANIISDGEVNMMQGINADWITARPRHYVPIVWQHARPYE